MRNDKQAWLLAVCGSTDEFPNDWLVERPDLLRSWPVGGEKTPGIRAGDHFLYYVPGEAKKLIAAGRAAGTVTAGMELPVQLFLAVPQSGWGPEWKIEGKTPRAIVGKRAAVVEDEAYDIGLELLLARARERFKS